jgi:dynein heavy chain
MERGLTPNKIVPALRATVDEYRLLLPVVAAMRNPALKERHLAKMFAAIGSVLPCDETFTLQVRVGRVLRATVQGNPPPASAATVSMCLLTRLVHPHNCRCC